MSNPYAKPWLSLADQVKKLEYRGLVVSDPAAACEYLGHMNYYRFAGYSLAFCVSPHQFRPGTTFNQVKEAADFDASLRSLVGDWLQVAELDIRTQTAHHFAKTCGAFGHCDASNFQRRFSRKVTHAQWLARLQKDTQQSEKERFVMHFKQIYSQYPDLPIWTAAEVMTFGSLARMIAGMTKPDRRALGLLYGFTPEQFSSTVLHLSYIRNVCAHHSRLWERLHQIKPVLPTDSEWQPPILTDNGRLFCTLLLLRKITRRTTLTHTISDRYRDKINALLLNPPSVPNPDTRLGLPVNWINHPVWK